MERRLNRSNLRKKEEVEAEGNGNKEKSLSERFDSLVEYTFNTPRDRMPEMTNLPLDQVRPQSMNHMYAKEVKLLEMLIIDAQDIMNDCFATYHPDSPTPVDVNLWEQEFKEGLNELLSDEYQYRYYQLRRSIGGDHKFNAFEAAEKQIEAQNQMPSEEDFLSRLKQQ